MSRSLETATTSSPQEKNESSPDEGKIVLKVSVRDLVDFVLQSGDLVSTFQSSGRALAGTCGHQKIQKSRPETYEAEVQISHSCSTDWGCLELRGRIDGVWHQSEGTVIEEIKTTTLPLLDITRDNQPLHWGQAKVYACLYAQQNGLERVGIQLTYLQLDTLEIQEYRESFLTADLEAFFQGLLREYLDWARVVLDAQVARDASIRHLVFPFGAYRMGQRELAVAVYRSIREGNHLFVQAPTGTGKTVATVFPALKALGEGRVAKIFYLTAKTVGRGVAEDTLGEMARRGLSCKVLTLTAKEKICFRDTPDCRPEVCEYARGHFDRVRSALQSLFPQNRFDREAIEATAREHRVCPFEFSLFVSLWADVIICDYNYAFDPRVFLRRFFEPPVDAYAFLVDEAHNLPDRARDMFSADLKRSDFDRLKKEVKPTFPGLARAIGRVTPHFRKALQDAPFMVREEAPEALVGALRSFQKQAEICLLADQHSPLRETILELFFRVNAFVRTAETFDRDFVTYVEPLDSLSGKNAARKKDLLVKLFCFAPTARLQEALERARCAVFFSATLMPLPFFFQMLGGCRQGATSKTPQPALAEALPEAGRKQAIPGPDRMLRLRSPFSSDQLGLVVIPQIRTEFRVRHESYDAIAGLIHTAVSCRRGNYLVYFPSYRYLSAVKSRFQAEHPQWQTIEQAPGMSEEERTRFLGAFAADNAETLIGFVVMGGIFGEGIDLRGERLIGSIIVGVGLPQICLERDLIRENSAGEGFEIAYRYPGFNRVMQAAGRVIRTEHDRGIVLLIDARFTQPGYRCLFPEEWAHALTLSGSRDNLGAQLGEYLRGFWGRDIRREGAGRECRDGQNTASNCADCSAGGRRAP